MIIFNSLGDPFNYISELKINQYIESIYLSKYA